MRETRDKPSMNVLVGEPLATSRIRSALQRGLPAGIRDSLDGLNAAQLADALEALSSAQREKVWAQIDRSHKGRVPVELRREVRGQLIAATGADELASALQRLDLDKLSDLYGQLPSAVAEAILRGMDAPRRARFDLVRAYPDDTAGGLMNADAFAVGRTRRSDWRAPISRRCATTRELCRRTSTRSAWSTSRAAIWDD